MIINKNVQSGSLKNNISTDILTIIMTSAIVLFIKSIVHEIIGHGGATLLIGEKITFISTMWLDHTNISSDWELNSS